MSRFSRTLQRISLGEEISRSESSAAIGTRASDAGNRGLVAGLETADQAPIEQHHDVVSPGTTYHDQPTLKEPEDSNGRLLDDLDSFLRHDSLDPIASVAETITKPEPVVPLADDLPVPENIELPVDGMRHDYSHVTSPQTEQDEELPSEAIAQETIAPDVITPEDSESEAAEDVADITETTVADELVVDEFTESTTDDPAETVAADFAEVDLPETETPVEDAVNDNTASEHTVNDEAVVQGASAESAETATERRATIDRVPESYEALASGLINNLPVHGEGIALLVDPDSVAGAAQVLAGMGPHLACMVEHPVLLVNTLSREDMNQSPAGDAQGKHSDSISKNPADWLRVIRMPDLPNLYLATVHVERTSDDRASNHKVSDELTVTPQRFSQLIDNIRLHCPLILIAAALDDRAIFESLALQADGAALIVRLGRTSQATATRMKQQTLQAGLVPLVALVTR